MIAKSQLIDETKDRHHLHDWLNDKKLKSEGRHLSEALTAELITHLTDNLRPTTHAIIELVDALWGIRYSVLA